LISKNRIVELRADCSRSDKWGHKWNTNNSVGGVRRGVKVLLENALISQLSYFVDVIRRNIIRQITLVINITNMIISAACI
jgi:hypothetical protein